MASLQVAGALAIGPTGPLYVADVARHRVLVRLPDGRFRVIAGTGIAGDTGNGGPALRAELSTVSALAFSPDGGLYVVDGGRVRVITPNGIIHTIAGDGRPAGSPRARRPAQQRWEPRVRTRARRSRSPHTASCTSRPTARCCA